MQVIVQQRDRTADVRAVVNVAKLSLVDLAGSERACHTENRGNRLKKQPPAVLQPLTSLSKLLQNERRSQH